jgi:hypothetical protein
MTISPEARNVIGWIIITIPTIEFGGTFLLTLLRRWSNAPASAVQTAYYRAGHAHAGVLVILAIIAQLLIDVPTLADPLPGLLRAGFFAAPVLVSAGFFAGAPGKDSTTPRAGIALIYLGAIVLAISALALGGVLVFGS